MSETQQADVIVVGGGPAGLAAAASAAQQGRRVLLMDEGVRLGGQIWRHLDAAELPRGARHWLARVAQSGVTVWNGASVVDVRPDRSLAVETASGGVTVRARDALIFCLGARERFLPFPGWTLPGVVGVGGLQALLKSGLQVTGARVVLAGSGPLLLPVAALLARRGARLLWVAEQAARTRLARFAIGLWRTPGRLIDAVRYRAAFASTRYRAGHWVARAQGNSRVEEAVITDGERSHAVRCDLLGVGYGLVPTTELPRLAGCALDAAGNTVTDENQQTTVEAVYCAGESTGVSGVEVALLEGQIAGLSATGQSTAARALRSALAAQRSFAARLDHTFQLRAELRNLASADTIVCRCEDVTYAELRECGSAREAKLYTRAGMGPCQGRICGSACAFLFGWNADSVRPPVATAAVGSLAHM